MIEAEWWDYESPEELAEAVAGDVGFIISSAVEARSASLIALPAGADERGILTELAGQSLPWKRVTIVPTDDLMVGLDDERSKVRMLAKTFLALGGRVFPVVSEAASDHRAAGSAADARLQDLPWPPDLVWLTIDDDGNVAGLVVGDDLEAALDAPKARRAAGLMAADGIGRISLTRAAILSARTLLITVQGQAKRDLLELAIADGHSSKLPVGRVLAEAEQPIDIHWCA
ncbi:MAG: 6-phosphogluconolactonase [Sphingomicrobium sp.]